MSLLLSIHFLSAYWPVVSSLILCMISSQRAASNLSIYMSYPFQLKETLYTFMGLSKLWFLHSENGSTLKGKNLLPFIVDLLS